MLGHHIHPLTLNPPDSRLGHTGGQDRILAEALLTASPTGVPEDVQRGHQSQVHPHLPQLLPGNFGGSLQGSRGKGGSRCQIHRQQVAVQGLVAVGALGAHEDRNPQAGMLQHIPLDLIAGLGSQRPIQAGGKVLS